MRRLWIPLNIDDYKRDTEHLTRAQHASYFFLIFHYWQHGGLPDDERRLASIAKTTKREWDIDKATLKEFFLPGWRHKRLDEDIQKAEAAHQRRVDAGKAGGRPKRDDQQFENNAKALVSDSFSKASVRASDFNFDSSLPYEDPNRKKEPREVSSVRPDEAEPFPSSVIPIGRASR